MLTVHRAERSSTLASALSDVLRAPLEDPFAREVIAVPAKGVERWLNQRLATNLGAVDGDGVAANIDFPSTTRLVDDAIAAAAGMSADDDPWSPSHMLWGLLDVIDRSIGEPWCAVLAKHLGDGVDEHRAGRRYGTAAQLSALFRSYGAQRPAMSVDWAAGRDTDGAGSALDDDLLWQAELWRRLRDHLGSASPAERLESACDALRARPDLVDLPPRLSLFGPTRLATDQLAVIAALAAHRDVHLWLPHPSPAMWDTLARSDRPTRRAQDRSSQAVQHPLLASLARDVRELQSRLATVEFEDIYHPGDQAVDSVLGRIQADVAHDRLPEATVELDRSVQVHACHGPSRQVEVLRESLLHLFEDDPTLEPRDVLVMCPDVDTYAPLILAAFGQGVLGHPGHRLRVRLADRGLRQTNPLLATLSALLELAGGRVTASSVLDLAAAMPVRTRFGFSDDDLERLREWTAESGARWGIGLRQRAAYDLADFRQNTFNTAVDRILLGAAADESSNEWLDLALPLDDVDSNDIDLAGRFAELVDRLAVTLRDLQGPQLATTWMTVLRRGLDLLTDVGTADAWQVAQCRRELASVVEHSDGVELRLQDVRAMLTRALAGRPTRANFRTGELTVCTMVPMRSVPHRVVVLLGLDDEVFPRTGGVDGDDVLARDPVPGERHTRSEDRQLLLDALMSAGERLLLFYTGADPVSGAVRPPAVPLSDVIDAVAASVTSEPEAVVRRHPLQPFDPRNFDAAAPFSFDRDALHGALASRTVPQPIPPLLPVALPAQPAGDVDLVDLIAFLQHPTQGFLRQRIGVRVPELDDDIVDALTVELGGLDKWDIGDRMLSSMLDGGELADFTAAEWRRGTLPPFRQGSRQLEDIERSVGLLAQVSRPVHDGTPDTVDVSIDLGGGRRLNGAISGVYGTTIARTSYSRLAPKHRIAGWVSLLATHVQHPEQGWQAVSTGRGQFGRPTWRSTLAVPADPIEELRRLVDLRDRGLREPLPVAPASSSIYADRRVRGASPADALATADKEWSSKFGEANDRHLAFAHGPDLALAQLGSDSPIGDEATWADESTRFGAFARRLWDGLLSNETVGQP
ncbi:exodeoxyribonuclease V subunit gamma [Antrihabitans cavernicola]|uniref:RecBCD enzyme subunit RecC n=1 Tax=Antrihabitans cavernicola TaxID=2495913 RepID=A0A5A7S7C4_9NOCA|nr:exodeoxyribonuclease V subunit gamma [Spelaeibacter cavernicola]KAA0020078.1 exodeoxyribonuclease V subunit gamma [Spelaeibacter cavernicola]